MLRRSWSVSVGCMAWPMLLGETVIAVRSMSGCEKWDLSDSPRYPHTRTPQYQVFAATISSPRLPGVGTSCESQQSLKLALGNQRVGSGVS